MGGRHCHLPAPQRHPVALVNLSLARLDASAMILDFDHLGVDNFVEVDRSRNGFPWHRLASWTYEGILRIRYNLKRRGRL